jgi:hypothetical protein
MTRRKVSNQPSARIMRQATAYARLSRKASINGQRVAASHYQEKYLRLSAQAINMRIREDERAALKKGK